MVDPEPRIASWNLCELLVTIHHTGRPPKRRMAARINQPRYHAVPATGSHPWVEPLGQATRPGQCKLEVKCSLEPSSTTDRHRDIGRVGFCAESRTVGRCQGTPRKGRCRPNPAVRVHSYERPLPIIAVYRPSRSWESATRPRQGGRPDVLQSLTGCSGALCLGSGGADR